MQEFKADATRRKGEHLDSKAGKALEEAADFRTTKKRKVREKPSDPRQDTRSGTASARKVKEEQQPVGRGVVHRPVTLGKTNSERFRNIEETLLDPDFGRVRNKANGDKDAIAWSDDTYPSKLKSAEEIVEKLWLPNEKPCETRPFKPDSCHRKNKTNSP